MASRTLGGLGPGFAYAAAHARHGWAAFPLMPGTKRPTPGSHGFKDATYDRVQLAGLWETALQTTGLPDLGVGFRCSGAAGFAVDLDVKNGKDGIRQFYTSASDEDPEGWWDDTHYTETRDLCWPAEWLRYRTRSGGLHLVFATPPGAPVATGMDVLGPGIDLRGPAGYRATYDPADPGAYRQCSGPFVEQQAFRPTAAPEWLLSDERLYSGTSGPRVDVSLPEGDLCHAVTKAADPGRWNFQEHHDCATRILHLVRLGEEGHTGVVDALAALLPLYVEGRNAKTALDGQQRDPEDDWFRLVEGALSKGTGATAPSDPCTRISERMVRFRL